MVGNANSFKQRFKSLLSWVQEGTEGGMDRKDVDTGGQGTKPIHQQREQGPPGRGTRVDKKRRGRVKKEKGGREREGGKGREGGREGGDPGTYLGLLPSLQARDSQMPNYGL
jgi:hypothetical protein